VKVISPYSTQSPSAPGYYWLKYEGSEEIVEIWSDPGHPSEETVYFIHHCGSGEFSAVAVLAQAQWAGPIPTPSD
jgi:hypothetical protein